MVFSRQIRNAFKFQVNDVSVTIKGYPYIKEMQRLWCPIPYKLHPKLLLVLRSFCMYSYHIYIYIYIAGYFRWILKMLSFSSGGGPSNRSIGSMWCTSIRILLSLMFLMLQRSDGEETKYWCIADYQIPDEVVQRALDWACGNGGDCSGIQHPTQPCFFPNTVKDHASYAFNTYYQRNKRVKAKAPTCYFNAAAILTSTDPSHGACKFEFIPWG